MVSAKRAFSSSPVFNELKPTPGVNEQELDAISKDPKSDFGRSEKASKAAQVNLSARLRKDPGTASGYGGFGEIARLLKIARPEAKWLGGRV